jgi:hypothetical protein
MIPRRVSTGPIFGNGLRERITACRRRLRLNRFSHNGGTQREELFPLADGSEFPVASFAMRQSEMSVNSSPALPVAATEARNRFGLIVEQEVGIT